MTESSRFIKSPNFRSWYSARRRTANNELLRLYLVVVAEHDFSQITTRGVASDKELELVDLLLRIKEAKVSPNPLANHFNVTFSRRWRCDQGCLVKH
jgi:hypothetical protein